MSKKEITTEERDRNIKYLWDLLDMLPEDKQNRVIHYIIGYMSGNKEFIIAMENAIEHFKKY